jgi:hypothetical protein
MRAYIEKSINDKNALKLWKRLTAKYFRRINGKNFSGLIFSIDANNSSLYVREQAQWLFSHDARLAVECFKTKTIEPFKSLDVLSSIK